MTDQLACLEPVNYVLVNVLNHVKWDQIVELYVTVKKVTMVTDANYQVRNQLTIVSTDIKMYCHYIHACNNLLNPSQYLGSYSLTN